MEYMVFAALIVAVDPVAVSCQANAKGFSKISHVVVCKTSNQMLCYHRLTIVAVRFALISDLWRIKKGSKKLQCLPS